MLERALEPVLANYDLILIDCPPSLGVLTINGLTAANAVLIPLQCEALSHRGVGQLLETIEDVRAFADGDLAVRGIIATRSTTGPGTPGTSSKRSSPGTGSPSSSHRCASRSASPRPRPGGSPSSSTPPTPRVRRPTANWPGPCFDMGVVSGTVG